jgi:hypothetical protein
MSVFREKSSHLRGDLLFSLCSRRIDGFSEVNFWGFPIKRGIDGKPTVNFSHFTQSEQKRQF